jgi:hypothetical protein
MPQVMQRWQQGWGWVTPLLQGLRCWLQGWPHLLLDWVMPQVMLSWQQGWGWMIPLLQG